MRRPNLKRRLLEMEELAMLLGGEGNAYVTAPPYPCDNCPPCPKSLNGVHEVNRGCMYDHNANERICSYKNPGDPEAIITRHSCAAS